MADPLIPQEALAYIKNKKLHPAFSYRDVWNEEHAAMFTVAKAMQIDVLSDIKQAVETAIEKGLPFEQFRKELEPTLREKGWWDRKDMIDPVTRKTVNAQLGSNRRLKTIYNTNLRSAYQEGRWERTQASTAHPYLMYRVGPSQNHRQDHLSWDGLILPKDDPWWNSHYPPNGWGCQCWTMAVSEERKKRLEQSGVTVPPSAGGNPGYTIPIRTQAPPTRYKTWVDNRTGRIEKIPEGVGPGFNWNPGKLRREIPNLEMLARKSQEKTPEQYDKVMQSLLTNTVYKTDYYAFIEDAFRKQAGQRSDTRNAIPAGFLDQNILKALRKEGKNLEENSLVFLEEGLVNATKFTGRHERQGNAPAKEDWYHLLDYLVTANVFLDKDSLIFLVKRSESKFLKIAVDLSFKHKAHKGAKLLLPKVDTMYELDISTETDRGIEEYNRIMKLKKIR